MAKSAKGTGEKPKLHVPEEPVRERAWECCLDDGSRRFREATRRVIVAASRDEAIEQFKRTVGIRATPHVIVAEPIEVEEEAADSDLDPGESAG